MQVEPLSDAGVPEVDLNPLGSHTVVCCEVPVQLEVALQKCPTHISLAVNRVIAVTGRTGEEGWTARVPQDISTVITKQKCS